MNIFYQQGDVKLHKVEVSLDSSEKEAKKNGLLVVAEGEHTGHKHAVLEKECVIRVKDGKRYVISEEGFTITHEEHKPISIPAGTYLIDFVQEYDHFAEEARAVQD